MAWSINTHEVYNTGIKKCDVEIGKAKQAWKFDFTKIIAKEQEEIWDKQYKRGS